MYKVLRRNISYNLACSIMEANHYGVTEIITISMYWTVFIDRSGRKIARYNEKLGRLDVICN